MLCKLLKMLSRDTILLEDKYTVVVRIVFSACGLFFPCPPLLVFSTAAPGKHVSCGLEQRME